MPVIRAAGTTVTVDRKTGTLSALRAGGEELPARASAGFVEIADLRDGVTYAPCSPGSGARGWKAGGGGVSFTQQCRGAPFRIAHNLRPTREGLRWEVVLRLLPGQNQNRSLRVSWVLPAPVGWKVWAPQDTVAYANDGVTPRRFVYGHTSFRPYGTQIPLVAEWGKRSALVAFSPPDVQKPFMSFELDTAGAAPVRGFFADFRERPQLRVVYHHVGLRPGKDLRLAVVLAASKPDWRCALGHYVKAYPDLFECIPATRKVEGMYGITTPTRLGTGEMRRLKRAGVTFAEVHGHFPQYSVYVEEEALRNPHLTWNCKPHPTKRPLSVADNRMWIRRMKRAGIAPFMYYYNCHALPATIARRWPGSTMRDERGKPLLKWYTEPSVWGPPDSPYGRHLLRQMDLLLEAYPETVGFFIDNYAIEMYDFSHDDGVTMVHDRPVYDLNRNHEALGPRAFQKAHRAGKVIMVNKISTIESLRGADMCLAETQNETSIRRHALSCVCRPLFPLSMAVGEGEHAAERGLQHLLINGCFPDEHMFRQDPAATRAYRPLTDAIIGKRWVLDFDPLDVPKGYQGQIFRIDRAAPHGGSVVVALADLERSYTQKRFTRGLSVTVRLPEGRRYRSATWLGAENSRGRAVRCKVARASGGKVVTVQLPPVGAAGVLRLETPD